MDYDLLIFHFQQFILGFHKYTHTEVHSPIGKHCDNLIDYVNFSFCSGSHIMWKICGTTVHWYIIWDVSLFPFIVLVSSRLQFPFLFDFVHVFFFNWITYRIENVFALTTIDILNWNEINYFVFILVPNIIMKKFRFCLFSSVFFFFSCSSIFINRKSQNFVIINNISRNEFNWIYSFYPILVHLDRFEDLNFHRIYNCIDRVETILIYVSAKQIWIEAEASLCQKIYWINPI